MKTKINFLFLSSIILGIFLVSLTSAAVVMVSPSHGSNHTGTALFNVSYANTTDITNPLNATFFYNLSGTWTAVGNTSVCSVNACWTTITISGLTDGIYGINATLRNATSAAAVSVNSAVTNRTTFDSTSPRVQAENFSSATVSRGNYSGFLNINVSIYDSTIGVQTVFFNITNSTTGAQAAVYTATNSATNQYNFTINTSDFTDGSYNITVYANDSLNNLNNTARIYQVVFDNTDPSASLSCSSSSVQRDASLTCSCSVSDAASGAQTPSYLLGSSPSTALTGTFTNTCTVLDYAGNSFTSAEVSYTVNGNAGSSGGGSSGGSSATTTAPTSTRTNTFSEVTSDTPAVFAVSDTNIGVSEVKVNVDEDASNVRITASKYSSKPSSVTAKTGKVYQYIEIKVDNAADKIIDSKITTKVEKSWVSNNGLARDDVALFRFNNNQWDELSTTFLKEDSLYYYYESTTPGFSFFALGTKTEVQNSPPNNTDNANTENTDSDGKSSNLKIFGIILIAVIAIGAIVFYVKKIKNQ